MVPSRPLGVKPKGLKRAHIRSQISIPQRSRPRLFESDEDRLCLVCHLVGRDQSAPFMAVSSGDDLIEEVGGLLIQG